MIPSLLVNHPCMYCAKESVGVKPLVQETAQLIVAHQRLKDQFSGTPRQDLPPKAAIALIQAAKDVEEHLNSLEPLERSKTVRLANCFFSASTAKL